MKRFLSLLILFNCISFPIPEEGSIKKQIDLVRDIEHSLPESNRERFRVFLDNIEESEKSKDSHIQYYKKESDKNKGIAIEKSEDAGKYYGIENFIISIITILGILAGIYLLYLIGSKKTNPL